VGFDSRTFATAPSADRSLCVVLERAPLGVTQTETTPAGGLGMTTRVSGMVQRVSVHERGETLIELARDAGDVVTLKALLPPGVDLQPLVESYVLFTLGLVFDHDRVPTVDTVVRDFEGKLVLWARDGRLPRGAESPAGFAVRVTHGAAGAPRLALVGSGSLTALGPGEAGRVLGDDGPYRVGALRVAAEEAAFILIRR
jgi:hypothetical protein